MSPRIQAELAQLRSARIYFHHHSVGENLLAGIQRLDQAGGGGLRVVSPEQAVGLEGPVVAHGGGGQNRDPKSKVDSFAATLRRDPDLKPDLAFMKLCYVDVDPGTDVEELFAYYRRALESLRRDFPQIRFAHVTVPVTRRPTDLGSSLRRLLGVEVWDDASNAKRADFNRRLQEAFPADPIFDLALAEATGPDGRTSGFEVRGRRLPSLHPGYTDDGGHLNSEGQRAVGAAAIGFIAAALEARAH